MAVFPSYSPSYSATKKSEPRTRKAAFGDGYEQRISFGLHQNPKVWSLEFRLPDEDIGVIETFLDARADDSASFDWTPPDSATSYKWVCEQWDKEMYDLGVSRISATFRQVFEP